MTLTKEWLSHCATLAGEKADFYSGCRKILRNRSLYFEDWDKSLKLADAGYTKSKMTMLTKNYLHVESQQVALDLWDRRRDQAKYGSVSFTTFNHFVKGKGTVEEIAAKGSKRASVFGPCIQAVTITWLSKSEAAVDISYRTTELFKKFPADLVFIRDVLLAPFDFGDMDITVGCHFANVTMHPMYAITMLPHISHPVEFLDELRDNDKHFWAWLIKWSARYICEEHHRGIAKFAQALRVKKDALDRLDPKKLKLLQGYFRDNHPGHRNDYVENEEDGD